jgi:hypothetical protein
MINFNLDPYAAGYSMRSLAAHIRESSNDKSEAASKLHAALRQRVRHKTARLFPNVYRTAGEAYGKKKGDSFEQTVLYKALAKEVGLKVRVMETWNRYFPLVETENGWLVYDTTRSEAGDPQDFEEACEKTDEDIHALYSRGRRIKRGVGLAKSVAFSVALSMAVNLTTDYWAPPLQRMLDGTSEVEENYEIVKQEEYFEPIEEIIVEKPKDRIREIIYVKPKPTFEEDVERLDEEFDEVEVRLEVERVPVRLDRKEDLARILERL